jgi:hypothetical protein
VSKIEATRKTMTEGKKRGRPPREVYIEIGRKLTVEDLQRLDTMRNRGGRPADRALNKELLKAADDARNIPLRTFICAWVKRKFGRMPDIKEIRSWERRIYRLRSAASNKPVSLRQNRFVN